MKSMHPISQNQPAFHVRVINFDNFTRIAVNNIVRTRRVSTDGVLGDAENGIEFFVEALLRKMDCHSATLDKEKKRIVFLNFSERGI